MIPLFLRFEVALPVVLANDLALVAWLVLALLMAIVTAPPTPIFQMFIN
jgi:hypothetical protein